MPDNLRRYRRFAPHTALLPNLRWVNRVFAVGSPIRLFADASRESIAQKMHDPHGDTISLSFHSRRSCEAAKTRTTVLTGRAEGVHVT